MSRGLESLYFTAFMGLVVGGALFIAMDWPVRASIVILFLGSIGVILALAQLVADFKAVHAGAKPAGRPT
ncbi:MAG: hypothetical protein ACREQP_05730, partial [Candidatus Binatia bacterium]